ncbi:MAG: AzlD domain-containing protein [Propionibacteriaceae bacterium]|jgi:branched-subunit amino acid transport protein|nr:AzlD domain-containing protein [Propionibacteriaceae bacterium]
MTGWWLTVVVASAACLGLKLAGAAVPRRWLASRRLRRALGMMTVGLLAGLVATQTFASADGLRLDARVIALAVAALLLWRRAPFLVVVAAGAAVAAGLRLLGWG